ncbi:MAG: IS66 family transposase [Candidatus Eisenbacteria bacterium]|nr:IS66 family transposase [Candidatus Eisenbacteria bacterium]MBU1949084.1 IS66 family transposase [Candidatus Eisenbacteria bacterium]
MNDIDTSIPDDNDGLKGMLLGLSATVQKQQAALEERDRFVEELQTKIQYLQERIRLLLHKRFGTSSEKLSEEQFLLFNDFAEPAEREEEDSDDVVLVKEHKRVKNGRKPLPDSLPRIEVIHDLSDEEKICPHDGTALKKIGQETSEQLGMTPPKFWVTRHIRPKYACPRCEETVKMAPPPPQAIPKSMAGPSLLAHIAVSKYVDALPLNRQSKMLKRSDIHIPRATLAIWMMKCGELVQSLINLMRDELLSGSYTQMDETGLQVLKEPGKLARSKSYLWAQRSGSKEHPLILFHYDPTRSGEVPKRLLEGFSGFLQVDGYTGYNAVCEESSEIRRVGCMAHARRMFDEAVKAQTKKILKKESLASQAMKRFRKLYRIEHEIRDLSPAERKAARQLRSKPRLDKMKEWAEASVSQVPPKSLTGQALRYLLNQWEYLIRYLEDGRLEIDNNMIENTIRPVAVGRRNWLFCDTVRGAEASANLYGLVETAKANGLDPYKYLHFIFTELPKAGTLEEIEKLLPNRCTAEEIDKALV